jgi:hypothetical protein
MREKHWLKVFENRVLRRIFWPKREEVTGDWRKIHTDGLIIGVLTKYYWGDEINKNEMEEEEEKEVKGVYVAHGGVKRRGEYRVLVGETREKEINCKS